MTSQRGWPLNPYEASVLAIFTFQSKQHALFAVGPRPAPGVTLLTPGLWHLFGTLQRLTSGVTAVIEKLSRRVLPRGPSVDHLVEPAQRAARWSGLRWCAVTADGRFYASGCKRLRRITTRCYIWGSTPFTNSLTLVKQTRILGMYQRYVCFFILTGG